MIKMQCRFFNTLSYKFYNNILQPKSTIMYNNALLDKDIILKDNKKKSGIYMWKNQINNKTYIGSAVDLGRRLSRYYQPIHLKLQLKKGNSAIYSALLKYDYSSFQLLILEYCEPINLIRNEQNYIDIYKPEYNILSLAGSRLGHKVSDKTKALISLAGLGSLRTKETRARIAAGLGIPVVVLDLKTNKSTEYVSISDAARFFNIYPKKIWRAVNNNKLYLGRYQITPIIKNKKEVLDKRLNKDSINSKGFVNDDTSDKSVINLRNKSFMHTNYFELMFNWIIINKIVIFLILLVIIMVIMLIIYVPIFVLAYINIHDQYIHTINSVKLNHLKDMLEYRLTLTTNFSNTDKELININKSIRLIPFHQKVVIKSDYTNKSLSNEPSIAELILKEVNSDFSSTTSPILEEVQLNNINLTVKTEVVQHNMVNNALGIYTDKGYLISRLNDSMETDRIKGKELLNYESNILYILVNGLSSSIY